MGTLVAYSALGASKVALAAPWPNGNGSGDKDSDSQALSVRRFDIPSGTVDVVLATFQKATGIHVALQRPEIGQLESPGVQGVYTAPQALAHLLEGTGVTFQFTARDSVILQLEAVSTSIEVSADVPEIASMPKYAELLRDTPQTVNVIPQKVMEDQGVNTLRDALRNVAGISLAAGEGGAQGDNLTIRGFSARNDIFMDGMRDFGSYYRDPFNLEQVEVLQGPSSVTFGRGSTGGNVNQESKTPETGRFIDGSLQFGSDLTRRITADINEPIGQKAAFRLNIMEHDSQVAERDIAENRRFGVAPSLAFGLGTTTRLTLSYLHQSEDDTPDYGIPWLFNGPAPVDRSNYYGFKDANFLRTSVDVATARFEHDFGSSVTLRNQARYGHYYRNAQISEAKVNPTITDSSGNVIPVTTSTPLDDLTVTRNQITVQSLETYLGDQMDMTFRFQTGFAQHTVVAGVEGGRETSSPTRFAWSGVPQTSLENPDENQAFAGTSTVSSDVHAIAISFGAYALDTVKLGRYVDLIGGVRWDHFDTDYSSVTPTGPTAFSRVDQKPSYRAAIVFKPKPTGSIYFDYGTSFNPSAESLSLSASTANLPPENNRTFEVGSKWDLLSKKLTIDGSIFQTIKLNAREPSVDNPLLNVLAGKQRVNGVQLAISGHISDRWQVLANYAYLDGRLVSSQAFPAAIGAQLANVPKNTFNLWSTYELPWRFTVGGGSQFVDSRTASSTVPFDPTTGLVKEIPSYWVFNAMASHPLTERVSLQLNLYNLANRYYFDEPHPAHIIPGAGFTALVGLNFKF